MTHEVGHVIPGVDDLARFVDDVMQAPGAAVTRGRTVWWDPDTGAIVIRGTCSGRTGTHIVPAGGATGLDMKRWSAPVNTRSCRHDARRAYCPAEMSMTRSGLVTQPRTGQRRPWRGQGLVAQAVRDVAFVVVESGCRLRMRRGPRLIRRLGERRVAVLDRLSRRR